MSAGDRDAFVRCEDSGPWLFACGNVIPQSGIKISQASHGTDRGHTTVQLVFGKATDHVIGDRFGQTIAHDLFHQRFIVSLLLLRLSVTRQMYMHIDQSWQDIFSLQVDLFIPGSLQVSFPGFFRWQNLCNPLIFHQNNLPLLYLHVFCTV